MEQPACLASLGRDVALFCSSKSNACRIVRLKRSIVYATTAWLTTNGQNLPIVHHIYPQSWDPVCIDEKKKKAALPCVRALAQ